MKTRSITIALLCMLAFAFSHVLAQSPNLTEIIIGEGNEVSCEVPFNSCTGGWAYTESIYPAEAIGGPCMIYSISFDVAELPSFWNGSWQQVASYYFYDYYMFLGTTDKSNYSSNNDWIQSNNISLVYERHAFLDVFIGSDHELGWVTFYLDKPYYYTGSNLMLGVLMNDYLSWDDWLEYVPLKIESSSSISSSMIATGVSTKPNVSTEGLVSNLRPNIKLGVITTPSLIALPDAIDLGYRPSGYWMEPVSASLYNEGIPSNVYSIECDNIFFAFGGIDTPYVFSELDTIPYHVSHGSGVGQQTGNLNFIYGDNKVTEVVLSAMAYTPETPDVWEKAHEVLAFPFEETISNNGNIHHNYNLPGYNSDGNDVVFKMTFDLDVYVDIGVVGNDAKVAVYEDDFGGKGGPGLDNYLVYANEDGTLGTGLFQGTYYVVVSSTSNEFDVNISQTVSPIPMAASSPNPVNHFNCYNENTTSIGWELGEFTHEYQLLFGETNPPEDILVDWTNDLAERYDVLTEDDKTYYWQINERNSSGTTEGPVWTFTTFKDITPSVDNIIYVTPTGGGVKNGSSWENAASNLQAAIDAAAAYEENRPQIWVAKGMYYANGLYEEIDGHACVFLGYNDVYLYGSLNGDEPANYDMGMRDLEANATILDAESVCYVVGSQGATWDGFVIQHGGEGGVYNNGSTSFQECKVLYSNGNGIYVYGGMCSLSFCQISYHEENGVIQIGEGGGQPYVKDCVISFNNNNGVWGTCSLVRCQICNNGNGAVMMSSGGGGLLGCLVANNDGLGTDFQYVVNSTIVNNGTGIGSGLYGGMDLVIANSIIWGNTNQLSLNWGCYYTVLIENNAIQDGIGEKLGTHPCIILSAPNDTSGTQPCFVNPTNGIGSSYTGGDWSLQPNSPCINNGTSNVNTIPVPSFYLVYYTGLNKDEYFTELDISKTERIQHGRIDIGAFESSYEKPAIQYPIRPDANGIIYVKTSGTGDGSSWDDATADLHQAIETAILYEPMATVWVAEGNYTADYSFLVKEGMRLFGGFAGNEPANYDLNQRDFNAHASVLDGGGTMRVLYQSDTLSTTTAALIDGFTLRNGSADEGAGAYLLKNATLSHCTVENNMASNLGGGIYAEGATVKDCFVVNNTASGQGGGIYAKDTQIIQSHIGNNVAETGGGVWASKSDILQCNIVRNVGDGLCIQADDRNSFVHFNNSILWGNEGSNICYLSNMAQANTIVKHCAIEGWDDTDNGNFPLSADNDGAFGPWFVEPSTETGLTQELGDWQLQEASLCIDAGENVASLPDYDIIGANRIQNGRTDMGAFESPYGALCVETDIREVSIRQGETYEFFDVVLSEAGTYEHSWTEGSCDSLVLLHLHVTEIVYVSENGSGLKDGSSWSNALDGNIQQPDGYTKLAHRLAEATPYTEFWLTDGLFLPCGDQDNTKSFTLNEGVRIYGGFAGTEDSIDERDPEHEATIFTGELQADNDSTNNTECLFVTASATETWNTPSIIDGATITHGYATTHQGAAIRVLENSIVVLNHCEVVENYEGAICNWGKLEVTDSNLSNNTAMEQADQFDFTVGDGACFNSAGALSNRIDGVVSLMNCAINSNHSPHSGALFNAGLMKIDNSEFDNNTSDWYGVGFSPGKIKIANSVFNNNRADNRIGVLYVWDSLEMVNCMISNNHSNYYAVYHYPETSSHYGGSRTSGIEANGHAYVSGCTFIGNNSNPQLGGALTINGTALIEHSSFINNKAMTPWLDPDDLYEWSTEGGFLMLMMYGGPCGAALYVGGTAVVYDCIFDDNKGYYGGTIGLRGSLSMNQCKITEGHLYELSAGGQFFGYGSSDWHYCSTICNWGGHLNISNSFIGNNEEGAIIQREESHTTITNSTIVNNNGDVLNFEPFGLDDLKSWGDMINCIVNGYRSFEDLLEVEVGNDSIICVDAVININNSLLKAEVNGVGNRDTIQLDTNHENNVKVMIVMEDGSIREQQAIQPTTSNHKVSRGHRDGDTNLYDVDPMFVNPTTVLGIDENLSALDADWRLQAGSPCINAGDATLIDLDSLSLDLGGEMRVKNCEIDMGAYEYGDMVWDTIADMTCEGEPYADNGFDLPAMDPGDYVFQRTGDCEDNTLHTLLLHVNPKTYHSICQVVTEPYELNGITYSESGTYVQTLPNQYGCDSIITLHLVVTPIYVQTSELLKGWTWWAPTVETNIADIEASLDANLEIIQARDGTPSGDAVMGQMYKIKTINTCELSLSGTRPASVSVAILPEVNWFGYIGIEKSIGEVFNETFGPADGDKIISQDNGFSIYTETNGIGSWSGTLTTLEPGKGYVYVSQSSTPKTVVFNTGN